MKREDNEMKNTATAAPEAIEITYHEKNGYLYPDLKPSPQTHYRIGKYGNLHLVYLKAHRPGTYTSLLTQFRLNEYLHGIDERAKEMVRAITDRLARERGVDETLKAHDGLWWAQEMNNCKAAAEEFVLNEVIYK